MLCISSMNLLYFVPLYNLYQHVQRQHTVLLTPYVRRAASGVDELM